MRCTVQTVQYIIRRRHTLNTAGETNFLIERKEIKKGKCILYRPYDTDVMLNLLNQICYLNLRYLFAAF